MAGADMPRRAVVDQVVGAAMSHGQDRGRLPAIVIPIHHVLGNADDKRQGGEQRRGKPGQSVQGRARPESLSR